MRVEPVNVNGPGLLCVETCPECGCELSVIVDTEEHGAASLFRAVEYHLRTAHPAEAGRTLSSPPSCVRPPDVTFVCPDCGEDAVGWFGVQEHLIRHSGAPESHPMHNGPVAVASIEVAMMTWELRDGG